jgi:integrase
MADLADEFLNSKRTAMRSDELSLRSFSDYFRTCKRLVDHFGKDRRVDDLRPTEFEVFRAAMAEGFGVVTLKNEINRCRMVFKYASDNRLIDRPVHYGSSFAKPSAKLIRRSRNQAGLRMFEADELRRMLDTLAAEPLLCAMTLLGVNCGFGNTDCANLPLSAVNLETGWIDYPRPKTEIRRRVPLWSETLDAIRKAIVVRPKAADPEDADCVFLTRQGRRWVRVKQSETDDGKIIALDPLAQRFARLMKKLGLNGRRGFYALRHTFETIGGESRDQVAVNAIMGHVDSSMAGAYRERISDERLQAVASVVHAWLWPDDNGLPTTDEAMVVLDDDLGA